jgi:hypothetical protein
MLHFKENSLMGWINNCMQEKKMTCIVKLFIIIIIIIIIYNYYLSFSIPVGSW